MMEFALYLSVSKGQKFMFLLLKFLFQERALEEQREMERLESFRNQIIEKERQRLLQEHAARLLGYLPKVTI